MLLPMLIIGTKAVLKNRKSFSARGAGILGFSIFGYDVTYGLNENFVPENSLSGIDRIVQIGQVIDMGVIRDGFDFVRSLSRILVVK